MSLVIFIRHAPTQQDKTVHSTQWQLTDDSQRLCQLLAKQIKTYDVEKIYTSSEHKAQLTGEFVAEELGEISLESVDNLHETERKSKAYYDSQDDFRAAVRLAMESPDEILFGDETFSNAKIRFVTQVDKLLKHHTDKNIAIVSHGRILSMVLSDMLADSPTVIWEQLQMPAYAVVSWNERKILKIQYAIEAS